MELFTKKEKSFLLADRMRPRTLDELLGQEDILAKGKPLRTMIESGSLSSMIFWGPPGSGKTSLAYIIAELTGLNFLPYSAVLSGIKEIKDVIKDAEQRLYLYGKRSILFIDEIHRFNKAQQDAFLPYLEKGTIILIGATTENPSFELTSPLLSRVQVFVLKPLQPEHIKTILKRALTDKERGLGELELQLEEDAEELIAELSAGDARFALNVLEFASKVVKGKVITRGLVKEVLQKERVLYDKAGEEHYNIISAFHKSLRDSDPDATLYWMCRMIAGGEDPLFIARRIVRAAIEDVGLADPYAVLIALAAKDAYEFLGSPEGELALAHAAIYLATAPKSNSVYKAMNKALEDIESGLTPPVPLHLRNAPTKLMKELGYGKDYKYAHSFPGHIVKQEHLPPPLDKRQYYIPTEQGKEAEIKRRLYEWKKILGLEKSDEKEA